MENTNSRRDFLIKSATLVIGTLAASSILNEAFAAGNFPENKSNSLDGGTFSLPALPYTYEALEPHIDEMTMKFHHDRHHKAYVDNLNKAIAELQGHPLPDFSFDTIFANVSKVPAAVRNNAGGHYNHSLFWTMMAPPKMIGDASVDNRPSEKLAKAISKTFGSVDEFKKQFSDAAAKRFGSGWAWLVKTSDGKLAITSTANQDNPLMNLDSVEVKGKPILALDVWEHAYYLKNQNRRADYIAAWWNVVNWETVETLYTNK